MQENKHQKRMIEITLSDFQKITDILKKAHDHHDFRDRMNAILHLATEVRFSPLTSELESNYIRAKEILQEARGVKFRQPDKEDGGE